MRASILVYVLIGLMTVGGVEAGNRFEKAHGEAKQGTLISIDPAIFQNGELKAVVATGAGRFDNALAMNIRAEQFPGLRQKISEVIGRPLAFFKLWNPQGEAHITVITPVEYADILQGSDPKKPILSMDEIGAIAEAAGIQTSPIEILSLGSGKKLLDGKMEETFFLIVSSENLLKIRRDIHQAFVRKGGKPEAWDPDHFYPHITIGYTLRDLHEADGVLKDVANSCDSRFKVIVGK